MRIRGKSGTEMPIVNVEEKQESRERSCAEMRVGKKEGKDEIRGSRIFEMMEKMKRGGNAEKKERKDGREEAANAERDSGIVGNSEKKRRLRRVYGNDFRRENESEGEKKISRRV